jgi:hypothetical protein
VARQDEKKVERAFEVIENLDKTSGRADSHRSSDAKKTGMKKGKEESGIRIHFSLDALISEKDTETSRERDLRAGKSNLLDIGFTVPYIWKIPLIGSTVLKIVKHLQAESYPETLRDILNSFRRNKNV